MRSIGGSTAGTALAFADAPSTEKARSVSASEVLFRKIVRGLYDGRYAPGQRLVEIDLSREYDVSRFVVREALGRLMAEGVVTTNFNRGAEIPRLTRKQACDTLEVMENVFALASRLAAERIHLPGQLDALTDSAAHLFSFDKDSDFFEFGRACSRFFRSITKIGDNHELQRLLPALQIHLVRVQFRTYPSAAEIYRIDAFKLIYEAIAAGDGQRSEAQTRAHFTSLSRDIAALPDRAFTPITKDVGS